MITPQELRIGNRLSPLRVLDPENIPLTGYAICAGHIGYSKEKLNNDWESIPLSPEILEKCGFQRIKESTGNINYQYSFQAKTFEIFYHCGAASINIGSWNGVRITIEYVHQLQNLLFSLTGMELEIKP